MAIYSNLTPLDRACCTSLDGSQLLFDWDKKLKRTVVRNRAPQEYIGVRPMFFYESLLFVVVVSCACFFFFFSVVETLPAIACDLFFTKGYRVLVVFLCLFAPAR